MGNWQQPSSFAFADLLPHWVPAGPEDGCAEDMRSRWASCRRRGGRVREALSAFEELRPAMAARHGEGSPEVRELDAYISKLRKYADRQGSGHRAAGRC